MQAGIRIAVAAVALVGAGCGKQADDGYAIKGTVNDAWDQPMAGVEIATPDGKKTTSRADGTFALGYGETRPAAITLSRPGWAVTERALAQSNRPADVAIGTVSMVPAPEAGLGDVFVLGDKKLVGLVKQPIEKLAVVPDPGGAPVEQRYRIAGAFTEIPVGKLRAVTTAAIPRLRPRAVFERAPQSFALATATAPLRARPMKVTGGGDMVHHEGITGLGPGRYILTADPDTTDGTVPEPTEGYLIVVK